MGFKTRFLSKFPRLYLLTKPNKITLENIKAYNSIKKNNLFDTEYYLNEYKDVKDSGMNPIVHYLWYGYLENKKPKENFDGVYYKYKYSDALSSRLSPLAHYSLYGIKENREYNLKENNISLLDVNKDYEISESSNILYLVHEKIGSFGGTGFTTNDIISNIQEKYNPYILTSDGTVLELWRKLEDSFEKLGEWNVTLDDSLSLEDNINFKKQLYSKELEQIYLTILVKFNINIVHINHLINHSFDINKVANKLGIPVVLSIHDFYYICPSIHLINNKNQYCQIPCKNKQWTCQILENKTPEEIENTIELWRNESLKFLKTTTKIIAPSQSTKETYLKFYPEIENKIQIITHGRDLPKPTQYNTKTLKPPIKILFPGYIGTHKGSLLIKNIKKQDTNNKLEFHFIGTSYPSLKKYGKNHGRYTREEFPKYVKNIKPSFIGILSTVPETYSHTLTESWNVGIPVIGTNIGAIKERINKTKAGYLIDYQSPEKAYKQILEIINNQEQYNKTLEKVHIIKFKTKKQMTQEYQETYDKLTENNEKYKISVIIPTYNTGEFLKESMGSLINQTLGFSNIEVLLVDDKSTDTYTLDLIKKYTVEYDNVKAIFLEENSGFPGYPRNVGINRSSSDYVMVMDHDDAYEKDALETLYNNIKKENADIAICNFNQIFEEGKVPYKSIFTEEKIKAKNIEEEKNLFTIPAAIWTRLFKKSFLKENNIKFLEGMLAEDVYVNIKSLLHANGIIYLNNYYGYQYKIRDTAEDKSTIHIRNKKYIEAILNGFLEIVKLIEEENQEKYSENIFKPHLTSWLYTITLSNTTNEEKKYLLEKAQPLYEKYYIDDPYFKGRYQKLVEHIQNKEYEKGIEEIKKLKTIEKNMNETLVENIRKNKKTRYKIKEKIKQMIK